MSKKEQKAAPLRLGIKYCGGCNPGYDRGELVSKLQKELSDGVLMVGLDEDPDWIIAVQGCPTACADLDSLDDSRVLHLTGTENSENVIRKFMK